ncbi:MAG: deoxyribonuclease, partial [Solirubrobacteraceae bacterium]|nr:deoxyribonuclease [Solirubrobacteraceae bacterium]
MLIGAHVSPAGGLPKAVQRGIERGCRSIQIFNQSPRMWRPTQYSEEDTAAFRQAMVQSEIESVLIHAVYLLNCASEDPEIRGKSLTALIAALRAGAQLGARCVVLHPGSALIGGGPVEAALERAAATI